MCAWSIHTGQAGRDAQTCFCLGQPPHQPQESCSEKGNMGRSFCVPSLKKRFWFPWLLVAAFFLLYLMSRNMSTNHIRTGYMKYTFQSRIPARNYSSDNIGKIPPNLSDDSSLIKPSNRSGKIETLGSTQAIDITKNGFKHLKNRTAKELAALVPFVKAQGANCEALFNGDRQEIEKAYAYQKANPKVPVPDEEYIKITQNCKGYIKERGFITDSMTEEEENFPLAYSLLVFKDLEQVERLLRAIYRPQNFYCVHVDQKSPPVFKKAMASIAACFSNVFLASRSVDVRWGEFSVLEPELICMKDLWEASAKWKYFINLTGQEFPLKTNSDIVKILKVYNGANDLEGTIKRRNNERYANAGPPPHGITITKGSIHIIVQRGFVDYVLHNQVAKDFADWAKKTYVPDETYFASLNHNPHLGIPGSYKGVPETSDKYPFLARYKVWANGGHGCRGQFVRAVCVFSIDHLPYFLDRPEPFINKVYLKYNPLVLDCLEELVWNWTKQEYEQQTKFDTSYYTDLSFVQNRVGKGVAMLTHW